LKTPHFCTCHNPGPGFPSSRVFVFSDLRFRFRFMVLNATFNNMSVISWLSVLLVEETGLPGENHRPAASHWQTLSHNVVSSTSRQWFNVRGSCSICLYVDHHCLNFRFVIDNICKKYQCYFWKQMEVTSKYFCAVFTFVSNKTKVVGEQWAVNHIVGMMWWAVNHIVSMSVVSIFV
jgi:hypothetical protein